MPTSSLRSLGAAAAASALALGLTSSPAAAEPMDIMVLGDWGGQGAMPYWTDPQVHQPLIDPYLTPN